jgi:hypothetical protein
MSIGPMPRIMPEPRYFSIPSVVGAVASRNEALNWTPCVRSLIQVPLACTNSPAEIIRRVTEDGDQVTLAAGFRGLVRGSRYLRRELIKATGVRSREGFRMPARRE